MRPSGATLPDERSRGINGAALADKPLMPPRCSAVRYLLSKPVMMVCKTVNLNCCGNACGPCADAAGCAGRVVSSAVTTSLCAPACDDGLQNGDETDLNTAVTNPYRCAGCAGPQDYLSGVCGDDMRCAVPACDDGLQNGDETDLDCGGDCGPCADAAGCAGPQDCVSGVCGNDMRCAAPTCDDGVQNGDETDLDCGGPCGPCADAAGCAGPQDCLSGVCGDDMRCAAPPATMDCKTETKRPELRQ